MPITNPAVHAPITLTVLNDVPSLVADQSVGQDLTTMVHLVAPTLESLEDRRQGITLSAVVDISGSMGGEKIMLMKESLRFMVDQLSSNDSFGIITFATEVDERFPLQRMSNGAKEQATAIIDEIETTSCTNLSGGLFAGINQAVGMAFNSSALAPSPSSSAFSAKPAKVESTSCWAKFFGSKKQTSSPAPKNATTETSAASGPTAVLLFTDGQANEGICDRSQLFAALKARLTDSPHVVVHTFGFGTDHDALLLQGIAEQSQGSYYFIKDQSVLKDSFADCLGGLVSVVSTGLTLRMAVAGGGACEVAQLMTKFSVTVEDDGTHVIAIKDLYSGESRDIPVQLKVRTAGVKSGAVMPLLTWTLSYHSTVDERTHTGTAKSTTNVEATKYAGAADVTVDEQRNRYLAAVALEEARKAAEARNFELAKQHIASCQQHIGQTASAETQYTVALQQEMHQMMDAVSDERHYAAEGSRGINQVMMRHQQQRCNDANESDAVMYQTSWKQEMKRRTK